MLQPKGKLLALFLTIAMLFTIVPFSALAQNGDAGSVAEWAGAMNFNSANNQITDIRSMTAPNMTEMKWAYPLNDSVDSYGAYYAGQSVIADGYLYATGGGKLHKVDIETGTGTIINDASGSTVSYYDYLCYADGILILSTQESLVAFDTDGNQLGYISGAYGYYHPVQYYDGHVICNGFIYKLEKEGGQVTFTQVGDAAIGGDKFNWSSGAFANDLFYVASKTTVYAVDYKTNTVVDSYVFDASRTATQNVQPGLCHDEVTGRLFWATYSYDSYIHSIAINKEDGETKGKFAPDSYITADAGQKSVVTPIVYNGRVYLAGQQGRMCVLNANDLTKVYDSVTLGGGKVQGNPILSAADGEVRIYSQGYNGHLYLFTDNGDSGSAVKLAETKNYTNTLYPNAFEQYAIDKNGNIYCYNESGYLFCFGVSKCEVPTITADLSDKQVKLAKDSIAEALTIEAEVSDGGVLSYQWQSSADSVVWSDIEGAVSDSYTPATDTEGTVYYRCVITNTSNGNTASAASSTAEILVKVLSNDTTLNVLVNGSNTLSSASPQAAVAGADNTLYVTNRSDKVTNIWVGTVNDATVTSFEILNGLSSTASMPKFTKKSLSNVYNEVTYSGYYRSTSYTLPIVAKATVTAEDGNTTATYHIVIDSDDAGQYIISVNGFTSESTDYFNKETGLSFTAAGQQATLIPESTLIGSGDAADATWTWSSSDLTVANVDENGTVTCIGGGSATITASLGRMSATCIVNSTAEKHSVHTYTDGVCSVCSTSEPATVSATFTLTTQEGTVAVSKDGVTELYKTLLSVGDMDSDGTVTLNDAFIVLHTEHSAGGADDFASSSGFMNKLWGISSYNIGYLVNDTVSLSLYTPLLSGDEITAFFYLDTTDYSDVYTYFSDESVTVSANNNTTFTVNGLSVMGNAAAVPEGATVNVFKENGEEAADLATKTDGEGKFNLCFTEAGTYTVQVSGNCSYTGSAWDYEINDYAAKNFTNAPIILSRMQVVVMPYTEATVYVTISDSKGKFSVTKSGEEMYRFPVKATDNPDNPDGQVSILEVIEAAHEQYHPEGKAAFTANNGFITHLWGANTGGSIGYFFNDVYLSGSGTKTGTNGREFTDKLLNTIVKDGDSFNIYALQDTKKWTDIYTYFAPVSQSAVAGKAESFTARAADYNGAVVPAGAVVTVTDSNGAEQTALGTTVSDTGTFTITFPAAGVYTAEISSNTNTYYVPSRCTVYVSAAPQGGSSTPGDSPSSKSYVYISVKDPEGKTYKNKTSYTFEDGETAYSLLVKTGLSVKATTDNQYGGVYIESIEGLGEFSDGSTSGWMYSVNGDFPDYSSSLYELSEGDYVEWLYTRTLGDDIGDNSYVGGGGGGSSTTYTVKFETNGGSTVKNQHISKNATVTKPTDPTKDGYAFEAWYTDSALTKEYNFTAKVTKDLVLYAKWTKSETNTPDDEPEKSISFADVEEGSWYEEAVLYAVGNGLLKGVSETEFAPDDNLTRAMFVTILYRMENEPKSASENIFTDVENGSWYTDAVIWANENNIAGGYGDGTFGTEDSITREQIAVLFFRYAELMGYDTTAKADLSAYTDADKISDWAADAISWANTAGLINGRGENTLAPKDTATRAEAAAIFMRFIENIAQ